MPVRVDGHKKCVAPRPRVVVTKRTDIGQLLGVACVEGIWRWQREVGRACLCLERWHRCVRRVVAAIHQILCGLLMIAVHEENGRRMAHEAEPAALRGIQLADCARRPRAAIEQRLDAEVVAECHVEIRALGGDIAHVQRVEIGVEHLPRTFGVRIALHPEREGASSCALRPEGALGLGTVRRLARQSIARPVEVARVRLQPRQLDGGRRTARER